MYIYATCNSKCNGDGGGCRKHNYVSMSQQKALVCDCGCFIVLQAETIMRISEYVKSHPQASQAQLKAEVEKEIKIFAQRISELEGM